MQMEAEHCSMSFEHCLAVFDETAKRVLPELVRPTPGIFLDTRALLELMSGGKPYVVSLRFN